MLGSMPYADLAESDAGPKAKAAATTALAIDESLAEAHVSLATAYYRLKRKEDGDRHRAIADRLTAEAQAKQPGAQPAQSTPATPQ